MPIEKKLRFHLRINACYPDLVKVDPKTTFCPPKGAKWGQSGPNPIFCPIMAIFTGKGPFWKFWTVVKSDFRNFDFWTPFGPPFSSQVGPIGAKSYFLPDHCHIHREGTFLEVLNSGKVRFLKIWLLDPIWPSPSVARWGQLGPNLIFCLILTIFAVKGPFGKLWTMAKSNFQKIAFSLHLTSLKGQNGAKSNFFHQIFTIFKV